MNRLVRISLTLFASATVLVLLVLERLQRLKDIGIGQDDALQEYHRNEVNMAHIGLAIAAGLIVIGIGLLVTVFIRWRKRNDSLHG